ncbi:uncharacterized protein LOC118435763 [Folsomia candida]|uniref:uncharacterized protein LOC118435763 n=1 Tax=Folsomia candida TaxID=158441 RepID=UPI001604B70A|nr:uncharacterized protein LOC118435763 [Folsomia candida]
MSSKYKSKSNEDMEKEDTNLVSLPTLMKTLNIANSVQTGKNIFNFMSPLETLQKQCLDGKAKLVEDGLKSLSENEIFKDLCGKAGYENLEAIAKNPSEFVSKHGCTLVHKELSKVQLHVANQAYKAELVKTAFNLVQCAACIWEIFTIISSISGMNQSTQKVGRDVEKFQKDVVN